MSKLKTSIYAGGGCLGITIVSLLVIGFNLVIGGMSVDYILGFLEKDIPFAGDAVIGLFVAQVSVPIAIVMWILSAFGVM